MDPRPLILHFVRQGYGRPLIALCDDTLKRRGNEATTVFWKAYGAAREGNFAQAIRDCVSLRSRRESEYAALVALAHYHRCSKLVDHDALASVDAEVGPAFERATIPSLVLAGTFAWVTGDTRTAHTCVDRALRDNDQHEGALTLRAWLYSTAGTSMGIGGPGAITPLGGPNTGPTHKDAEACLAGLQAFQALLEPVPPSKRDPDAVLGLARVQLRCGQVDGALDTLGQLTAAAPWFAPAYTTRAEVLLRLGEWDSAREILIALLSSDPADIEGNRLTSLIALTIDGPGKASTDAALQGLVQAVMSADPRNPRLLADVSRCLARCACRHRGVLGHTLGLVETASRLDPDASYLAAEVGYQRLLLGDVSGAAAAYREAAKLDESNSDAVSGLIAVQLAAGDVEDAASQLEMFRLIASSLGKGPTLAILEAGVALRRDGDRGTQLAYLRQAYELHCASVLSSIGTPAGPDAEQQLRSCIPASSSSRAAAATGQAPLPSCPVRCPAAASDVYSFYAMLQPELLLDIAREALIMPEGPGSVFGTGSALSANLHGDCHDLSSPAVGLGLHILSNVCQVLPGCLTALELLAVTRSACGDTDGAQRAIGRVLAKDPSSVDAHLLLATVELHRGQPRSALSALERALSVSFSVQQHPAYHRLRAEALQACGRTEEALTAIETALKTPPARGAGGADASRRGGAGGAAGAGAGAGSGLSLSDRASLLTLQVNLLLSLHRVSEAAVAAGEATSVLRGTPEESRAVLCNARLALAKDDPDGALELLATVPSSSPAYTTVLELRADLYLRHRRDRRKYIQCFEEAVRRARSWSGGAGGSGNGGARGALLALGDAYKRMSSPESAVLAYAAALGERPSDTIVVCKIGQALLALHDYRASLNFYTGALRGDLAGAVAGAMSAAQGYAESAEGGSAALGAGSSVGRAGEGPLLSTAMPLLPPNAGAALDRSLIRSDLTGLLVQLKRHDEAKQLIQQALADAGGADGAGSGAAVGSNDVVTLRLVRQNLLLMAKVQRSAGDSAGALQSVSEAYGVVMRSLDAVRRGSAPGADGRGGMPGSGADGSGTADGDAGAVVSLEEERRSACLTALELASAAQAAAPPDVDKVRTTFQDAVRHAEGLSGGGAPEPGLSNGSGLGGGAGAFGVSSLVSVSGGTASSGTPGSDGTSAPSSLHEQASLALARFYFHHGEEEACRDLCTSIVKSNPGCTEAALLLADVQFRGGDTTAAIYHYTAFLESQPCNYHILFRLAGLLKRSGRLGEVQRFLKAALKSKPSAETEVGYKMIKGVVHRWSGEPSEAIQRLNGARISPVWALTAVEHMVQVYLSPEGDPLWLDRDSQAELHVGQQALDGSGAGGPAAGGATPGKGRGKAGAEAAAAAAKELQESLTVCGRLLEDLPPGPLGRDSARAEVLRAYLSIVAGRSKSSSSTSVSYSQAASIGAAGAGSIDDGIARLATVLEADPDHVPALLALSTAFMVQGQAPKARNTIKRLLKTPGADVVYSEEAAQAWLLLADIYSESGKLDQAQEALQRALAVDASCARAHEALGGIAERELRYAEAADLYARAWTTTGKSSAPLGYKLAFNQMKAQEFTRALDTAREVLKASPNYPRIREDIIQRSQAMIRP